MRLDSSEVNFDFEIFDTGVVFDVEDVGPFFDKGTTFRDLSVSEVGRVNLDLVVRSFGIIGWGLGAGR